MNNAEFEDFLNEINAKFMYLTLMHYLDPKRRIILDDEFKLDYENTKNIIESLNSSNYSLIEGQLSYGINGQIEDYAKWAKTKVDIFIIADKITKLLEDHPDMNTLYNLGIEFGWLEPLIFCENIVPTDFPFHGRIGIYTNAGRNYIEEFVILEDAFFLLNLMEKEFKKTKKFYTKLEKRIKIGYKQSWQERLNIFTANICIYSRICIQTFVNFVEVFVNSIGYDFYARNKRILTSDQIEKLKGFTNSHKKKHFLSLANKMRHTSHIIRQKNDWPLDFKDKSKINEPFYSFFNQTVPLRNDITHFSPIKNPFRKTIEKSIDEANQASKCSVEVAREFWKTCYPSRNLPKYILSLNYDLFHKNARKWVYI
jgi:hypothetical protein